MNKCIISVCLLIAGVLAAIFGAFVLEKSTNIGSYIEDNEISSTKSYDATQGESVYFDIYDILSQNGSDKTLGTELGYAMLMYEEAAMDGDLEKTAKYEEIYNEKQSAVIGELARLRDDYLLKTVLSFAVGVITILIGIVLFYKAKRRGY